MLFLKAKEQKQVGYVSLTIVFGTEEKHGAILRR